MRRIIVISLAIAVVVGLGVTVTSCVPALNTVVAAKVAHSPTPARPITKTVARSPYSGATSCVDDGSSVRCDNGSVIGKTTSVPAIVAKTNVKNCN